MKAAEVPELSASRSAVRRALRALLVSATTAASRPVRFSGQLVEALSNAWVDAFAGGAALHSVSGTVQRVLAHVLYSRHNALVHFGAVYRVRLAVDNRTALTPIPVEAG